MTSRYNDWKLLHGIRLEVLTFPTLVNIVWMVRIVRSIVKGLVVVVKKWIASSSLRVCESTLGAGWFSACRSHMQGAFAKAKLKKVFKSIALPTS